MIKLNYFSILYSDIIAIKTIKLRKNVLACKHEKSESKCSKKIGTNGIINSLLVELPGDKLSNYNDRVNEMFTRVCNKPPVTGELIKFLSNHISDATKRILPLTQSKFCMIVSNMQNRTAANKYSPVVCSTTVKSANNSASL